MRVCTPYLDHSDLHAQVDRQCGARIISKSPHASSAVSFLFLLHVTDNKDNEPTADPKNAASNMLADRA
jgi:hypothetical protein